MCQASVTRSCSQLLSWCVDALHGPQQSHNKCSRPDRAAKMSRLGFFAQLAAQRSGADSAQTAAASSSSSSSSSSSTPAPASSRGDGTRFGLQQLFRRIVDTRQPTPGPVKRSAVGTSAEHLPADKRVRTEEAQPQLARTWLQTLPRTLLATMQRTHGQHIVETAVSRMRHAYFTTSFSGCGFAEVAAEALASAAKSSRPMFGPAIEKDPACQAMLRRLDGQRCVFRDILEVDATSQSTGTAHCVVHNCMCPLVTKSGCAKGRLRIEIAGPPCPPWSMFGAHRGTEDVRFELHQAQRTESMIPVMSSLISWGCVVGLLLALLHGRVLHGRVRVRGSGMPMMLETYIT